LIFFRYLQLLFLGYNPVMMGSNNKQSGRTKWIVMGYLTVLGIIALIGMNLNKDTCEDDEEEATAPSFVARAIQFVTGGNQDEVAAQEAAPTAEDSYDPWKDRPKVGKPKMPRVIDSVPDIKPSRLPRVITPQRPRQPKSPPTYRT